MYYLHLSNILIVNEETNINMIYKDLTLNENYVVKDLLVKSRMLA